MQYATGYEDSIQNLGQVKQELQILHQALKELDGLCGIFNFNNETESCFKLWEGIALELDLYGKLWEHINVCENQFEEYLKMKWVEVNSGEVEDEVKKLRKTLLDIRGIDRKTNVFGGIQEQMKKWNVFLPLMSELKDPSMETEDNRHWEKIKALLQKDFVVDNNLILQTVWDFKLYEFKDGIEEVTDQSKQELKMSKQLAVIINFWKDIEFELVPHKTTSITTLKMIEENFEMLEEHQLQINNMLLSKYIAFYEKKVEKWKQDLGSVYDVIVLLTEVQKTWSFLENLFIQSEEVKRELPNESKHFISIDEEMKDVMTKGSSIKNCLAFCTTPNLLKRLENVEKELKVCEKALNEFLDSKRRAFPRFYFVSVNDLLDILSNGNSPAKINRHMSKIFQAIEKLTLVEDPKPDIRPKATEIISCVGQELVKFQGDLQLLGKVEVYLQDVIDHMRKSLLLIASSSFKAAETMQRKEWLERDPAQITILVNMIRWSSRMEDCFEKISKGDVNSLKTYLDVSINLLTDLIKMVQGKLDRSMR